MALFRGESEFVDDREGHCDGAHREERVGRARLVHYWDRDQVRLVNGTRNDIEARSRETIEAPGDQVVVRVAPNQGRFGDASDGSHEREHGRHRHEIPRCAHHEKVDWIARRQATDAGRR